MRIVVIGAGVMGLLTAFKLAKAGHQVTILEKNAQSTESSWAGGVGGCNHRPGAGDVGAAGVGRLVSGAVRCH